MGGISANKPIIHLVTGPMMPGSHRGVRIGACTDCRNNWAKFRAGAIDIEDIAALNEELAPTVGSSTAEEGVWTKAELTSRTLKTFRAEHVA